MAVRQHATSAHDPRKRYSQPDEGITPSSAQGNATKS
jgi:hypothetical protein